MTKHVTILGAGIVGLSTAYYCARRGWRVTIVERSPQRRDGCSFGNAGMIVASHFVPLASPGMVALGLKWMWNPAAPFHMKPRFSTELFDWAFKFFRAATPDHVARAAPLLRDLSLASRNCYEELAELPGNDFGLVKNGLLTLCKEQHALDEEDRTAQHARRLGLAVEVLDAQQVAALDPDIRMSVAGGVYYAQDCHVVPDRVVAGLEGQLRALGATFHWTTDAIGWRIEGDRRLRALITRDDQEIAADEFVVCGGAWSPLLVRGLGLRIPLQAGKGYNITLARPRQLPRICAILSEARVAVTPMGGALRFAGTMELAGRDPSINPVRVRSIIAAATRYYPDFKPSDFADARPWSGLRPCSPDGMPYVGRTTKYSNLSIATGHAMMGMSLGPITGKIVADILAGEPPPFDLTQLSPDRY